MKMTIWRCFDFSAAHSLPNLPKEHQCSRVHGHNYSLKVELRGEVDPFLGWVQDFGILAARVGVLVEQLDHRCLNEVGGLENPTAENLALWFCKRIALVEPLLVAVEIQERGESGVRLEVKDMEW